MARNSVALRPPVPTVESVTPPSIRPTVIRGAIYFAIGDVSFASVRQAATALSAAESHRLDIIDHLTIERRFRSASKREAFVAAQIRQLREVRHG